MGRGTAVRGNRRLGGRIEGIPSTRGWFHITYLMIKSYLPLTFFYRKINYLIMLFYLDGNDIYRYQAKDEGSFTEKDVPIRHTEVVGR